MSYTLIRGLLFRLDPETAHELIMAQMKLAQRSPMILRILAARFRPDRPGWSRQIWGLEFPNPIGIAAGFDKNAEMIPFLAALGFGFIEVGTVTLRAQPGNPKPRLFRYPRQRALVNRLGFNNAGAAVVAAHLLEAAGSTDALPPLFVNIGKNREVPLEAAADVYAACYRKVAPHADGVVVNVSSPNTPGLRDLQRPESLAEILESLRRAREDLRFDRGGLHPILVKIAPDLYDEALEGVAAVCVKLADGMVATNTTLDHGALCGEEDQAGGLSGEPLFDRSTEVLRRLRALVGPDFPLIGVGGVRTSDHARRKIEAGADLVQAYTGFIYEGPGFVSRVMKRLEAGAP
ncbi:MAG TPA: quinone-dependent dihydroorotate dehydrogenase [Thermoanaerobaculia bacterium]|nr:quinone-dependent dihydroorotate dehydrogenase [Thermoanaerobaculia bacterium]